MGIDHNRAHIALAQQFLYGLDIRFCLEQMRRKAVSQRMHADMLVDASLANSALQLALKPLGIKKCRRTIPDCVSRETVGHGKCP